MAKTTRRILLALTVVALIVTALCITVAAEDAVYNFSYESDAAAPHYDAANPQLGGWHLSASNLSGATGVSLNFPEASSGIQDAQSRFGTVPGDIRLTYYIPADEQVAIKDYNAVKFDRRLSNGIFFTALHGSSYNITLTMDDGQTISKDYLWFDIENTLRAETK